MTDCIPLRPALTALALAFALATPAEAQNGQIVAEPLSSAPPSGPAQYAAPYTGQPVTQPPQPLYRPASAPPAPPQAYPQNRQERTQPSQQMQYATPPSAYQPGATTEEQDLLNRADVTVKFMRGNKDYNELDKLLPRARAVFVVPQLIKAAFFFGGEGGNGVMLAKLPDGTWSAPSFAVIGSASFGLQAGAESSEIVFVVMTDKGLNAILDRDVKLGAGVSVALITLGKGIGAGTGIDTDADIYAVAKPEGLFGGLSLDGSIINPLDGDNQAYYGQKIEARDILNGRVPPPPGAQALIEDLR